MRDFLDISAPLDGRGPFWPGSPGLECAVNRIDRGESTIVNSVLSTDTHAGTHLDAPLHHIAGGMSVDEIPLRALIGPCWVVDCTDVDVIDCEVLEARTPNPCDRVLLRTRNSAAWRGEARSFSPDFVALSLDGAQWLSERASLVGTDGLSIQPFGGDDETHRVLLRNHVVVVEGLDLTDAQPGRYELVCLPIRLVGAEAAPARAVIRPLDEGTKT